MEICMPPRSCASSSCGVPSAATWPRLMISTREQVLCTSGRMWVLRMTVWSVASSRIKSRIWMICVGSRPLVGSSRISTGGLWIRAWAMPTRCL
ncbi:hypothetical protein D3C78_1716920 [compost metagenome]